MPVRRFVIAAVLVAVSVGCGGGDEAGAPAAATSAAPAAAEAAPASAGAEVAQADDAARVEAEKIFAGRCFTCHGLTGEGNGPGSAALTPKPRNFHDVEWQASVTDDHLAKIIQYGGAAVGKSPVMPGNPDLMSKPQIVQALVAHIRGLGAAQ